MGLDQNRFKDLQYKRTFLGHGGMDNIMTYRLIECLRNGWSTDMDVYDAASLSVVIGLSEMSLSSNSQPVDFPDFTRGRWKTWQPASYGLITM